MQENFELETILSVITGISFAEDYNEVFKLAWFVYDDSTINTCGLCCIAPELKEHLLNIHPELINIGYTPVFKSSYNKWIELQKAKFGECLPVSKLGKQLDENVKKL